MTELETAQRRIAELEHSLARCRDAFHMPPTGSELDDLWRSAMQRPDGIPAFVEAAMQPAAQALDAARASHGQAPAQPDFSDVIAIQRAEAERNPADAYMVGLHNGMAMMEANYKNAKAWHAIKVQPGTPPETGEPMGTAAQEATAWRLKAENLERENAALRNVLKEAATSLETVGRLAGKTHYVSGGERVETYMGHHDEVRSYANARASVARAALAGTAPSPSKEYVELPKPPHWGAMHTGRGGKVEMYPQQYREALDRAFTVGATHALRTGGKP